MKIIFLSIAFILTCFSSISLKASSEKLYEITHNRIKTYQSHENIIALNVGKENEKQINQTKFCKLKDNICRTHFILNNETYVKFSKKTLKSERIKEILFDAYYEVYEQIVLSQTNSLPSEENLKAFLKFDILQTRMKVLVNKNTKKLEKQLKGIHNCDRIFEIIGIQ